MPDLTTVILFLIAVFVCGIAAGALVARRWSRGHGSRNNEPDSGLGGLVERTASLDGQMSNLHTLMLQMLTEQAGAGERLALTAEQTAELHRVLASPKHRGDWGQILAEDVLQAAGLQHQVNYVRQRKLNYGDGRPDFTFVMPDGLDLHLDVKFPLANFRRMEQADTDGAYEEARSAFVSDMKRHIKALPARGYADAEHTVGFVLLFIANKAIFDAATEADSDLMKFALSQHVAICCPQTLMSVLLIARNAANSFRVQRKTIDVLRCIEGFQAEWAMFIRHLDKTDRQLTTFMGSWESLKGTRRIQLQKRLDRIDELDVADTADNEPVEDAPEAPVALTAPPQAAGQSTIP